MSAEMGPKDDAELTLSERTAALLLKGIVRVFDHGLDDKSMRFNPVTATLSLSGESERPGDRFSRGKIVAMLCLTTALVSVAPVFFVGELMAVSNPYIAAVGALLTGVCGVAAIFITSGATDLIDKVTVYDHTTEPAPDAVEDLKERYMNDEIDDAELEREAAEVWANE